MKLFESARCVISLRVRLAQLGSTNFVDGIIWDEGPGAM